MSALDNVIGYKRVKEDLRQIIDILKNPNLCKEMSTCPISGTSRFLECIWEGRE